MCTVIGVDKENVVLKPRMNERLFDLVLNSGVVSERKEATERLDLKSRVEEEKFRKLSADLERRRIRRHNQHVEEQKKVKKELDGLQRDRLRYEREKVLRRRNTFSTQRERKQSAQTSPATEISSKLPNENAFGGSASIAFDPSIAKYRSRNRRRTKTKPVTYSTGKKAVEELSTREGLGANSVPCIDGEDGVRTQTNWTYSGKADDCRRWGTAWLDARKEQESVLANKKRWNSLLLKAESDKMKALSGKWTALKDSKLTSIKNLFNSKHRDVPAPTSGGDNSARPDARTEFRERVNVESQTKSDRKIRQLVREKAPLALPKAVISKFNAGSHEKNRKLTKERNKIQESDKEENLMPSVVFEEFGGTPKGQSSLKLDNQRPSVDGQHIPHMPVIGGNRGKERKEMLSGRDNLCVGVIEKFLPQLYNDD